MILKIIKRLEHLIYIHCKNQILAGADVIQLFDSWAGLINKKDLKDFCINPNKNIVNKSNFQLSAEKMHRDLGPALCLAKWKQVSLHLPTGLNNSCYHPPLHKIPVENLAIDPGSLHNTPHKKAQRVMMLQNKKPEECQYCWNMEAENKLSDRHYRSGEPWAAVDFEKIQNSTGEENDVIPSYVEVNFNNVCNLMCSYCSPQFSSSWQQEVDRSGGYPTARVHNDPGHFGGDRRVIPVREHNPYVELKFINDLEELKNEVVQSDLNFSIIRWKNYLPQKISNF